MFRCCLVAAVCLSLGSWATAAEKVAWKEVYKTDFAGDVGPQWSSKEIAPTAPRRLGDFDNVTVTLSLDKLPAHRWVKLAFDAHVGGSWDGSPGDFGPDEFSVKVEGGATLLRTSFDHAKHRKQAYPDNMPLFLHPAGTGAAKEENADSADSYRAVYRVELVFPHSAAGLKLAFAGKDLEGVESENWGLGNVQVSVADAATVAESSEAALAAAWDNLAKSDAKAASQAIADLIGAGAAARVFLKAKLVDKVVDLTKFIEQLDAEQFETRVKAQEALIKLGPSIESAVEQALEAAKSAEVRMRLQRVLASVRTPSGIDAKDIESIRRARAMRALSILESAR